MQGKTRHLRQMTRINQTTSGKAWEYAVTMAMESLVTRPQWEVVVKNDPFTTAKSAFDKHMEEDRDRMSTAAKAVAGFLRQADSRLDEIQKIYLQTDSAGVLGDVRDIVIATNRGDIGISAKQRHKALKHPRISKSIDIGKEWYGSPCSDQYWEAVHAVFDRVGEHADRNWNNIEKKVETVYLPILNAVKDEIIMHGDVKRLMEYFLGRHDYYKVVQENGTLCIESYNMFGTNMWGDKIKLPQSLLALDFRKKSKPGEKSPTTLDLAMDNGWSVSLRIHNADSKIAKNPSLKFDVNLIGSPEQKYAHFMWYNK